jgi:hypothetical protein
MDDLTFQIKNLEFHIKQTALNHDKCVSRAIKKYMESDSEFNVLIKPCESLKTNLDDFMKKYEELSNNRLDI